MNVLILGSGGREHALAWRISKSQYLDQLYVAPGNAGTLSIAKNVPIVPTEFVTIKDFVLKNNIDMIVVGPEAPLVQGIKDFFDQSEIDNLYIIGPSKAAAMLEGSKDFAKEFMLENNIPTAKHQTFTNSNVEDGKAFLEKLQPPYVLKADGLAGGKGVLILNDLNDAKHQLDEMLLHQKFGDAANQVVIEEFLDGTEVSVFVLTDGEHYKILPTAKDYKRIGDGDTGLNTGGMGAVSPNLLADEAFIQKVEKQIVKPTLKGLKERNYEYKGFIFLGLMIIKNEPYVIEYNVRLGDPETQAILPRIETDSLELLIKTAEGQLNTINLSINPDFSTSLVLSSDGYPGKYEKGKIISGLGSNNNDEMVFHAGTKLSNGNIVSSGGRVLAVTSLNEDLTTAINQTYAYASKINFDGKYNRNDIGEDLKDIQNQNRS